MTLRATLGGVIVALGLPGIAWAATAPGGPVARVHVPGIVEGRVAAGSYYVGRVFGPRDYRALANASTPGYLVMLGELTQGQFRQIGAWASQHGYTFGPPCKACDRAHPAAPVVGVSWREAALLANALSEMRGLDPVYRDKAGAPVRSAMPPEGLDHAVVEPSQSGYRLPTIPEWHIAMRGGGKALAEGSYGATPGPAPNALGLTGAAGPLAEWTGNSTDLGDGKPLFYACNEPVDEHPSLTACDPHSPGFREGLIGLRFVRKP